MDMENVVMGIVIAKSCQKQAKNSKAKIQRKKSGYFLGFFSLDFFFCIFPWIVIFGYFSPIFLDLFFSFSCQKFFPISPQNFLVSFEVFSHFSRDFWIFSKSPSFFQNFPIFPQIFQCFSKLFQFFLKLSSCFQNFSNFSSDFPQFSDHHLKFSDIFPQIFLFFPKFASGFLFSKFSKFSNFSLNFPISLRFTKFSNFLALHS